MEKLLKKPSVSDQELQKALKKVKKVNNFMEKDYMAATVTDSLKAVEYALRPLIYQGQEDKESELLDVAEQGKVLLYAIAVASEEIIELAKETLIPYAKEHPIGEEKRK